MANRTKAGHFALSKFHTKKYGYFDTDEKSIFELIQMTIILFSQGNPTIFIESTIHAREWITAATTTYFLNELLTSNNTEIRNLANNYDWVIVPVVNVDGYEYTHNRVSCK